MAGITSKIYASIRLYVKRRAYKRLDSSKSSTKRRQSKALKLRGAGRSKDRSSLKLRPMFRLRLRLSSPIRLLTRLRDAYMDAMLALAGGEGRPTALKRSATTISSQYGLWAKRMPRARQIPDGPTDFEQRMIVHLYRSLVAPPEITAH